MDVVYVFRHSQFDDLEIQYSLRSVAKYLPWIRKVWIFGDHPNFLSEQTDKIEHVSWESVAWVGRFQTPVKNHFLQYFLLSLWPELDEEFLIFHDDHILLDYLTEEVAKRNRIVEEMSEVQSRGTGEWREQLWRSFDWWLQLGYPTFNFETHTPRHMTKRQIFDAYAQLRDYVSEDRHGGMVGPSGILNHAVKHEGIAVTRRDDEKLTLGFVFNPARYEDIVNGARGKKYLFFNEGAFSPDMRRFLTERFPLPCIYESRDQPSDSRESTERSSSYRRYDVLYLTAKSKWGDELKYSLRSFEKFFPQLGRVWIFGHLPDNIDPAKVLHINEPEWVKPPVFVESAALQILNNKLDRLSEDFILAQDDNYLLRPVTFEDFGPLNVQNLDEVQIRGSKPWQLMLWRTFDLLKFMGHSVYNYESHTPHRFNRSKLRMVSERFTRTEMAATHRYHGLCIRMAYWNILKEADRAPLRSASEHRVGFTQPGDSETVEQISAALQDRIFMFHDDNGLSDALKSVLETRFPNKSHFER